MMELPIPGYETESEPPKHKPERNLLPRSVNRGWTPGVSRRNTQYLQSIDFDIVPGTAYAVTLTIPAAAMNRVTPDKFHRWLDRLLGYLKRRALLHYYWVLEFTAQSTPHLHCIMWFDDSFEWYHRTYIVDDTMVWRMVIGKWVALLKADDVVALPQAQDVRRIDVGEGWAAYCAKHASRGVRHYQRQLDNMPYDWKVGPGRMWGHDRKLPVADTMLYRLDLRAFHVLRRQLRRWCISRARLRKDPDKRRYAIASARRMLRCTDPDMSAFKGIMTWIPREIMLQMIYGITADGRRHADRLTVMTEEQYNAARARCTTYEQVRRLNLTTKIVRR